MAEDDTTAKLYATTDAMVWAEEWCRIARGIFAATGDDRQVIDPGWIVGWFANAMGVAENHHNAKLWAELRPMIDALALELPSDVWNDVNRRVRQALSQFSPEMEQMLRDSPVVTPQRFPEPHHPPRKKEGGPDIILLPYPHTLRCPGCQMTRNLPEGWQAMLHSETLTCVECNLVMEET